MGRLQHPFFVLAWFGIALSPPSMAATANTVSSGTVGTVQEAACRLVESAASASHIPVSLLTRLMWVESRFQAGAVSPKGAQGIAQFMPETAVERGLADPFDPEQAIPKAAKLLADLEQRFGNVGLAAAAYNAGANRLADWLAGKSSLPAETQAYVLTVTGRTAEDWAAQKRQAGRAAELADNQSCLEVTAALRTEDVATPIPLAPWGIQLSGNFSKAIALASFERARQRYVGILGNLQPMILGTVLRSRGTRPFYRVLVPEASRAQANQVCHAIMADGGACITVRT